MKISANLKGLMLAAAASALTAGGAMAADLTPIMTTPTTTVTAPPAAAFAWAGPYAGISGSMDFCGGWCWVNANANVGYNFVSGSMLFGAQGTVGYWWNGSSDSWLIGASARAGYIFGNALAYAKVGYIGYGPTSISNYYTITGGLELGIGQAVSLFAEGGVEREFGGGTWYPRVEVGLNWHFGG